MMSKAYDLLSQQHTSAVGLESMDRARIIISAIRDDAGHEYVLSRFGDQVWDLRPFFEQSNLTERGKFIVWPRDISPLLVEDCKAALYAWFKRGRPGMKQAAAVSVAKCAVNGFPLLRWLCDKGLKQFDQVRPMHVSNYALHCKSLDLTPGGIFHKLQIFDILWIFRADTANGLNFCPWGESTLQVISGITGLRGEDLAAKGVGKTPIIPRQVQAAVFRHCETVMAKAGEWMDRRDAGELHVTGAEMLEIRDAAMYLLSISSGMRNEEVIGVETGAGRTELRDGVPYHWVASVEHKTDKGRVEYLIPETTLAVLRVLERYVRPLQERLAREIALLEADTRDEGRPERLQRLAQARKDVTRLFLAAVRIKSDRIEALSNAGARFAFLRLAKAVGVDWKLTPHQCRRTYARMFVESRMGRQSLVFLKWQFKHSSMSMSQLYAANPLQDPTLFDDILAEIFDFKQELLTSWGDSDTPLSGGAGRRIMQMRATHVKDRKALLTHTAQQIHIRATGHGWCMAQDKGCGGAGLYEASRCVDCKHGVIDGECVKVWRGIYEQQQELLAMDDLGPGVHDRAQRDVAFAKRVIEELGVTPGEGATLPLISPAGMGDMP